MGLIKENELCEKVENYFLSANQGQIEVKIKSKMYYNLGRWMRNKSDNLQDLNIEKINQLYKQSLELNQGNHKTWHRYALLNLEASE